jgi:hypothetical protein
MRDQLSPADDLPALYREVLDAVSLLERQGLRVEAGRIRVEATETYSVAWDDEHRQRLQQLVERSRHMLERPARRSGRLTWRR